MAAIFSNGSNRWNILGTILLKEMRYLVYIRYLWPERCSFGNNILLLKSVGKCVIPLSPF